MESIMEVEQKRSESESLAQSEDLSSITPSCEKDQKMYLSRQTLTHSGHSDGNGIEHFPEILRKR